MQLILWRHAEAVDGFPDMSRELTGKGRQQARAMARWLRPRLPADAHIIASPAARARQTAEALSRDFLIDDSIAPGASCTAILAAAGWPDAQGTVVLIGHQPTLGEAAAELLAGNELPWSIKKGALWWLKLRVRDSERQVVLRAVMSPDMLA